MKKRTLFYAIASVACLALALALTTTMTTNGIPSPGLDAGHALLSFFQ